VEALPNQTLSAFAASWMLWKMSCIRLEDLSYLGWLQTQPPTLR